jgi:hypothetical protein
MKKIYITLLLLAFSFASNAQYTYPYTNDFSGDLTAGNDVIYFATFGTTGFSASGTLNSYGATDGTDPCFLIASSEDDATTPDVNEAWVPGTDASAFLYTGFHVLTDSENDRFSVKLSSFSGVDVLVRFLAVYNGGLYTIPDPADPNGGSYPAFTVNSTSYTTYSIDLSGYEGLEMAIGISVDVYSDDITTLEVDESFNIDQQPFTLLVDDITFDSMPLSDDNPSDLSSSVKLFPNPTNGIVSILSSNFSDLVNITITNQLGQVVKEINPSTLINNTFDISNLNKGIYFIQIRDVSNNSKTLRVVKN